MLVIHGADDLQTEDASRAYAQAFPNARFEDIDGASHFAFEERPEAFAQIVGQFLESLR